MPADELLAPCQVALVGSCNGGGGGGGGGSPVHRIPHPLGHGDTWCGREENQSLGSTHGRGV